MANHNHFAYIYIYITPVRLIQCSLDVLQYSNEYLDTEFQSPDFHHLALTTCFPEVRQCIAKPHIIASLLVYVPLYHLVIMNTIFSYTFSYIFLVHLSQPIKSRNENPFFFCYFGFDRSAKTGHFNKSFASWDLLLRIRSR